MRWLQNLFGRRARAASPDDLNGCVDCKDGACVEDVYATCPRRHANAPSETPAFTFRNDEPDNRYV